MPRERYVYNSDGKAVKVDKLPPMRIKDAIGDEITGGIEHPANREICYSKSRFNSITKAYGLENAYGEPDKYFQKEDTGEQEQAEIEAQVEESLMQLQYGEALTDEDIEKCKIKNQIREWEAENG